MKFSYICCHDCHALFAIFMLNQQTKVSRHVSTSKRPAEH